MPELPEVQTIVSQLGPLLTGARVARVRVARRDVIRHGASRFERAVVGRRVVGVSREAKRIVVSLEDGARVVVHLGMTGRLTVEAGDAAVAPHTHVVWEIEGGGDAKRQAGAGRRAFVEDASGSARREAATGGSGRLELRFRDPRRFGGVWYVAPGETGDVPGLGAVGPDALTISARALGAICRDRRRTIKGVLLDQPLIAGLGNIYCDEALFDARIHPLASAGSLDRDGVRRLATGIRKVLRRSLESGGSTLRDYRDANGNEGTFQRIARVYGREGMPCRRCRGVIERILVVGRGSHVCPGCQGGMQS